MRRGFALISLFFFWPLVLCDAMAEHVMDEEPDWLHGPMFVMGLLLATCAMAAWLIGLMWLVGWIA